jgi:hypothetical protein
MMNPGILYRSFLILLTGLVAFSGCNQPEKEKTSSTIADKYTIAAYIWPSCHHDERFGDMLWPEGTGEWEIIKKGNPRFDGHYQPKVPLWGYEMDDDPKVMEKWIDVASSHGIDVFIFDWYWYDSGPFLESSLNDGFLKASNRDKMQFYVMWANHDVKKNYWNVHAFGDDTSLLWGGAVDMANFRIIADRVIRQYFMQPNYFKIDGKPVFSIFSIDNLIEGLGGLELARDALDEFREKTVEAGFPGLHVQLIGNGGPREILLGEIEALGVNSITKYNWGGPHREDYIRWGMEAMERREQWEKALSIPFFPNVSIGWDDTPRFPAKGQKDMVHYNQSPESFGAFLQVTKEYLDNHPDRPGLMTIFSWNEWIEGGYLLPDMKYGFSFLETVNDVTKGLYDAKQEVP